VDKKITAHTPKVIASPKAKSIAQRRKRNERLKQSMEIADHNVFLQERSSSREKELYQ
jgi:hypothetical protein